MQCLQNLYEHSLKVVTVYEVGHDEIHSPFYFAFLRTNCSNINMHYIRDRCRSKSKTFIEIND